MKTAHHKSIIDLFRELESHDSGLTQQEAQERLIQYGKNEIIESKKKTPLKIFLSQFTDIMIIILVISAIVSGLLGDKTDMVIIIAIVILNSIVGFIQEYKAEKAMEALKKMASGTTIVQRNGIQKEIPTAEVVPGDIVSLEAGNIIPADIRLIETFQFKVDESALTGESHNIEKNAGILSEGHYALGDILNTVFKGTNATNGRARGIVVSTGMKTELGQIAKMVESGDSTTPLQKRLSAFAKRLSFVILFICAGIFLIGYLRGGDVFEMLLTSLSLAVAAIPEALPTLVTVALALGASKLVEHNALIRKLPAVETLGSVTYICSDKTGTLTVNKMTVEKTTEIPPEQGNEYKGWLLKAMALNNDVFLKENTWSGESTEMALFTYADANGARKMELESLHARIKELPFDSVRKCMSTIHKNGDSYIVLVKGAPDVLLNLLDEKQRAWAGEFAEHSDALALSGYRVLGFAAKQIDSLTHQQDPETIESGLTLIGFAGMIDPAREEAMKSVDECKKAGIVPVMITGDHKLTATAIAKKLGIISAPDDLVLTGKELEQKPDTDFEKIVPQVKVYARVNPAQKLRIIKALQKHRHFVAMTGDGVNDAPALKNADIGVAMGINGTEVSKEAAHMILLDDNFATIVVAIKHGRKIFDNILKFIKYTMTSNSGEIWAIVLAPFFGLPIPLLAIHILWINLVTDGLPGLALAVEPSERNIMERRPRDPSKNIFAGGMAWHILWVGLLMGFVTLGMQAWAIDNGIKNWQTMAFTVLCFSQMGHVMAVRSERQSLFSIGVFSNKPMLLALTCTFILQFSIIYIPILNPVFRTNPLSMEELVITLVVSSVVFWAVEAEKQVKKLIRKIRG